MVTLAEHLRNETAYHTALLQSTKVLHHDCVAASIPSTSTSRFTLATNHHSKDVKFKTCSHGFKSKGTTKKTIIRDGFAVWVFEWVSDGVSQPRFVFEKGECVVDGIIEADTNEVERNGKGGEGRGYELRKMGWREGLEAVREVRKLGEMDFVEYVH